MCILGLQTISVQTNHISSHMWIIASVSDILDLLLLSLGSVAPLKLCFALTLHWIVFKQDALDFWWEVQPHKMSQPAEASSYWLLLTASHHLKEILTVLSKMICLLLCHNEYLVAYFLLVLHQLLGGLVQNWTQF